MVNLFRQINNPMKNSQLAKVLGDLNQNRFRAGLVITALVLACAGIGTVSGAFSMLQRNMDANFYGTNPAHATIWADTITDRAVAVVRANPLVEAAEPRRVIEARLRVGPDEWKTLWLFVVHDFGAMRVNKIGFERGAIRPGLEQILLERSGLGVARADVGDSVTVQLGGAVPGRLRVAGVVHDPALAPSWMHSEVYGYVSPQTLPLLGDTLGEVALKLTLTNHAVSRAEVQQAVLTIRRQLTEAGIVVRHTDVPPPATHPHDRQLKAILSILSFFSVLLLLLAGVLIANLLAGIMGRQIREVGIMKAIGGSTGQIARLYLTFTGLLVAVALPVGIGISVPVARAFAGFVAGQLNFNLTDVSLPPAVWLAQIGVCAGLPLFVSSWQIWRGSRITVLDALNDSRLQTAPVRSAPFRGWFAANRPLVLTLRNMVRRRRRFALTVLTLALGGAAFLTAFNIRQSWQETIAGVEDKQRYDLDVRLWQLMDTARFGVLLRQVPGATTYEAWGSARTFVRYADGSESLRFDLMGLPDSTRYYEPQIIAGRGLSQKLTENEVVATKSLMFLEPTLRVGQRLTLLTNNRPTVWRLVGITYEADAEPTFYTRKRQFDAAFGTASRAANFRILTQRTGQQTQRTVLNQLESRLSAARIGVLQAKEAEVLTQNFRDHFTIILTLLLVVAGLLVGVGTLGLASTMSINVLERIGELRIMRVIGASARTVAGLILAEGLLMGLLGWVVSLLIALPLSFAIDNIIGNVGLLKPLVFSVSWGAVFGWLLLTATLSALASLYPATRQ
jgi:putative ABC transport system permease protein